MSDSNKDSLKSVMTSLLDFADTEAVEVFAEIKSMPQIEKALQSAKEGNVEEFYYELIYPLSQAIDGLLHSAEANDKLAFIFKHYNYVNSQIEGLIEKVEGAPFSADKSSTVLRDLIKFYMTGEATEFNYNADITYHLPKNIFTTHGDRIKFFEAIMSLYYGKSDAYLTEYLAIMQGIVKEGGK